MTEQLNSAPRPFDVYGCALTGRNMVTAGAGTGKTYSIQILFLRMILDAIPVKKILVVTFTNLATDELKNRLRQVLQLAFDLCDALLKAQDDDARDALLASSAYQQVAPCFRNALGDGFTAQLSVWHRLLVLAMQDFDNAPISTIHGFCSRILKENAFDSGVRYGMEMRSSIKALTKQALSQFWRAFCNEGHPHRQLAVKLLQLTPDSMQKELDEVFRNPGVPVCWNVSLNQLDHTDNYLGGIESSPFWDSLKKALNILTDADMEALGQVKGAFLKASQPIFSASLLAFWKELGSDAMLNAYNALQGAFKKKLDEATAKPDVLGEILNKTYTADDLVEAMVSSKASKGDKEAFHALRESNNNIMGLCSALPDVFKLLVLLRFYKTFVLHLAWKDAEAKLAQAKARDGFMTYDDLLLILSSRLGDKTVGQRLRQVIQAQYSAVIVDEFQDTDAHQSAIFNALLSADGTPEELLGRTYFMIGDEKQAIYMFRGGDVHTFFKEKQACGSNVFSLTKNFRSSSAFISTMNDFWEREAPDFFQPEPTIAFETIGDPALDGGRALQLLHDDAEVTGNALLNFKQVEEIHEGILNLIKDYTAQKPGTDQSRYVMRTVKGDGNHDKQLDYSDIAVLVRTNKMGVELRDYLRSRDIPAVLLKSRSLFKSPESLQMLYFLDAVLNPGDTGKALFLLLQKLFCLPAEDLDAIRSSCLPRFQVYLKSLLEKWQGESFLQMFASFMQSRLSDMMPGVRFQEQPSADDASEQNAIVHVPDATVAVRIASCNSRDSLALFMQLANMLHCIGLEKHLGARGVYDFLDQRCEKPSDSANSFNSGDDGVEDCIDEEEDDDELYSASLPTQDAAIRILTVHASKGLQFPVVLVPQFTSSSSSSKKTNRICQREGEGRVVNMGSGQPDLDESCNNERYAELKRLMYVAITRAQFACHFVSKVNGEIPQKPSSAVQKELEEVENNLAKLEAKLKEKQEENKRLGRKTKANAAEKELLDTQIQELKGNIKAVQTFLEHPEMLLAGRPSGKLKIEEADVNAATDAATGQESASSQQGQGETVSAEVFRLQSDAFVPGWLTTSFSEMSKGRLKPDRKPSPPQEAPMQDDDDTEEDAEARDTMCIETWQEKVPYAEREPIFQFVGGKRTGTCWHKVFEELDFTLFDDAFKGGDAFLQQQARIIGTLDTYGQLGHGASRESRIKAFMDMLERVCRQTIRIGDETPWRLADVPTSACLHECGFTYRFRKSATGNELRAILDRFPEIGRDIRTDWMHGFSDKQMFTGSIDLLFQNPADGKYVIVDWKTNLLDANPASFTAEGVRQEMLSHVYPLQCILYSVAFIQYYSALAGGSRPGCDRQAAIAQAYSRFGGCADLFVRGLREKDGQLYGVYPIKPPLELLLQLDECCGVTLNNR